MPEWTGTQALFPNGAAVSGLSRIAETGKVPPEFYMSPRRASALPVQSASPRAFMREPHLRRVPLSVPLPILSHRDLSAVKSRFEPISPTLTTCEPHAIALQGQPLRHLTPLECERLMGFPDGYTDIPWPSKRGARSLCEPSGRPPSVRAPKTARYKALGNSWAINCARWVLRRLDRELHPLCNSPARP